MGKGDLGASQVCEPTRQTKTHDMLDALQRIDSVNAVLTSLLTDIAGDRPPNPDVGAKGDNMGMEPNLANLLEHTPNEIHSQISSALTKIEEIRNYII